MSTNVNAEIISIGTEILLGEITDTNSVHIAHVLRDIGVNLYYMTSVGDNEDRIAEVIRHALSRSDVIITCGGLGPTVDDMTRQAVAKATDRGLTFHQNLLDTIAERFASFRATMTENNRRQAYLPDGAIVIENSVGTAPCFIVEHQGRFVISLPGVPREMKFLMAEHVVPFLHERYHLGSGIIKARTLRAAGVGESALDELIGQQLLQQSNPTVGLAAHAGIVDVRITAKADSKDRADEMIAAVEAQLRARIGKFIFGIDEEKIEEVLTKALQDHHATLAISETGISDGVLARIKAVAPDENLLLLSHSYSTPAELQAALSIVESVPLGDLAERAAQAIAREANATLGIAVISRPEMDEHADKDAGTAIAVTMGDKTFSRVYGFGGQSEIAAQWTSTWAMSRAWRMLQERDEAG